MAHIGSCYSLLEQREYLRCITLHMALSLVEAPAMAPLYRKDPAGVMQLLFCS